MAVSRAYQASWTDFRRRPRMEPRDEDADPRRCEGCGTVDVPWRAMLGEELRLRRLCGLCLDEKLGLLPARRSRVARAA